MSNTRRTKWTTEQVTAANAEQLLSGMWAEAEAAAAKTVVLDHMAADLGVTGDPAKVATLEQAAELLGDDYWTGIYAQLMNR